MSLAKCFLDALDEPTRAAFGTKPQLTDDLERALAAAREAWPEVTLSSEIVVRHIATCVVAETNLAALPVGDLYLACGCARGDAAALAAFEREHLRWLHGVLRKSGADDDTAVEVLQNLRRDLLTPRKGQTPGIAAFAGRAELRSWLRVAAVRELARVAVRARREVHLDTHEISALPGDDDVETRHLKALYRDDFKIAFNEAMAHLTDRQRRLLRYQVIERLSIDEIGALHRVHRATAARWLVEARAVLNERTRALLGGRLRIEPGEVQSVLKLVESQIDVSVERLLKQP